MGVYFISDINNEVVYIGQSINVKKRLKTHFKSGKTYNCAYILQCEEKDLDKIECKYIVKYKPLYNRNNGNYEAANLILCDDKDLIENMRATGYDIIGNFVNRSDFYKYRDELNKKEDEKRRNREMEIKDLQYLTFYPSKEPFRLTIYDDGSIKAWRLVEGGVYLKEDVIPCILAEILLRLLPNKKANIRTAIIEYLNSHTNRIGDKYYDLNETEDYSVDNYGEWVRFKRRGTFLY